ncbi:MAG: hypothetical protein ACRYGP_07070 [Janthinobacterium lividum]
MRGGQSEAQLDMEIRDFDPVNFAERKRAVERAAAEAQARHPRARISCRIEDCYSNIDAVLGADRRCVDLIFEAMEALGIPAKVIAMRGGTDG